MIATERETLILFLLARIADDETDYAVYPDDPIGEDERARVVTITPARPT